MSVRVEVVSPGQLASKPEDLGYYRVRQRFAVGSGFGLQRVAAVPHEWVWVEEEVLWCSFSF